MYWGNSRTGGWVTTCKKLKPIQWRSFFWSAEFFSFCWGGASRLFLNDSRIKRKQGGWVWESRDKSTVASEGWVSELQNSQIQHCIMTQICCYFSSLRGNLVESHSYNWTELSANIVLSSQSTLTETSPWAEVTAKLLFKAFMSVEVWFTCWFHYQVC